MQLLGGSAIEGGCGRRERRGRTYACVPASERASPSARGLDLDGQRGKGGRVNWVWGAREEERKIYISKTRLDLNVDF